MPITIGSDANDFASAADYFAKFALDRFNAALKTANIEPPQPAGPEESAGTKEKQRKKIEDYDKAKSEMAAALAQIGDATRQANEVKGYAAIALLMVETHATAAAICARIKQVMGTSSIPAPQTAISEIDGLARALTALAAVSPAELWQKTPPQTGSTA